MKTLNACILTAALSLGTTAAFAQASTGGGANVGGNVSAPGVNTGGNAGANTGASVNRSGVRVNSGANVKANTQAKARKNRGSVSTTGSGSVGGNVNIR